MARSGSSFVGSTFLIVLCMITGKLKSLSPICQPSLLIMENSGFRYTSLGSTYNTWPNPALLANPEQLVSSSSTSSSPSIPVLPVLPSQPDSEANHAVIVTNGQSSDLSYLRDTYKPAYELVQEELERAGRGKVDPTQRYLARVLLQTVPPVQPPQQS